MSARAKPAFHSTRGLAAIGTGDLILVALVFLLSAYTQLTHLTTVPGLHFDEAWQGLFANRIAGEPGFFPFSAMNSYTGAAPHYLLAAAFAVFEPSLSVMRGTLGGVNLLTLALILALLTWQRQPRMAAWFGLLWALLPLSVHNHRFYIEVTSIHGLCVALGLWAIALWPSRPRLAPMLLGAAVLIGTYSHVLFIAVAAAGAAACAVLFPREFTQARVRRFLATIALLLSPLPFRMGLGLGNPLPLALGLVLITGAAILFFVPRSVRLGKAWERLPRLSAALIPALTVVSIPFLVAFVGLLWNGVWPYAQATGYLDLKTWLPLNAVLFLLLVALAVSREHKAHGRWLPRAPEWVGFIVCFALVSILIFKQAPRYYMAPAIIAMLWCARELSRLPGRSLQLVIATVFVAWNLWAFETRYLSQFERFGATTVEFRLGLFHDNSRDFRPFQKAFQWATDRNCHHVLDWVEDDRFGLPVQFLRLTMPPESPFLPPCPWGRQQLFFSHIPNYDRTLDLARIPRNASNTPPPVDDVKILAHLPEWGDLAFWTR